MDLGTYDSLVVWKKVDSLIMLVEVKLNDCVNLSMWGDTLKWVCGNKYEQPLMTWFLLLQALKWIQS